MAGPVARRSAALSTIALFTFCALSTLLALCAGAARAGEPGDEPGRAPRPERKVRLSRLGDANVVDDSLFQLAEFYLNEGRTRDAVAALERVAKESPDPETRSTAHFNLAVIHSTSLDDPDRARAEYAKVTGRWAPAARMKVIRPLRAQKRWAEAADFLKECLAGCEEPADKAQVVRMLVSIARSSGDDKLLEDTLRSVPDLVTYEEAQAAAKADREKMDEMRRRIEAARPPLPDAAPVVGKPGKPRKPRKPGKPGKPGEPRHVRRPAGQPDGGAPPVPVKSPAELEAQIRELERAGFSEEARRLREELMKLKEGADPEQF